MFAEDLPQFVKDFGVDVVFSRSSVEVATVKAILDSPPKENAVYDRSFYDEKFYAAKLIGAEISLYGIASQLADIQPNDVCTISTVDYRVQYVEPDGTGMMFVHLSFNQV